jgi:hypothetical protein
MFMLVVVLATCPFKVLKECCAFVWPYVRAWWVRTLVHVDDSSERCSESLSASVRSSCILLVYALTEHVIWFIINLFICTFIH